MTYLSHLMTIGIFARSTQLSVKALRLYDQLDILKPQYTDPLSGYRYYHAEQIHTARLIRMMRLMDMPLALIRQVVEASPQEAEKLIHTYLAELQAKVALAGQVVQSLMQTLKGDSNMSLDVRVKTTEKQIVLSMTHHIKVNQLDDIISRSIEQLKEIAATNHVKAGVPFGIFHGQIDHESDGPIEICLPVSDTVDEVDTVDVHEMPSVKVVSVDMRESDCAFPDILKGYDALVDWMRQNGYQQVGSPREIWHSMSAPEHMEIVWAFQEKSS